MIFFRRLLSHIDYPDNWREIKKEVLARDNWQCQECGAKNSELHVHHKVPLSRGGGNTPANLISLCKNCHTESHTHMRWVHWVERNRLASIVLRILFFSLSISALLILVAK